MYPNYITKKNSPLILLGFLISASSPVWAVPTAGPTMSPTQQVCMVTQRDGTKVSAQAFVKHNAFVEFNAITNTLTCKIKNACSGITIENCNTVTCAGYNGVACSDATIRNAQNVNCIGSMACQRATFENNEKVTCDGYNACKNTNSILAENAAMHCKHQRSCERAKMTGSDAGEELLCGELACHLIETTNVAKVTCEGEGACTLSNLNNPSSTKCSGSYACMKATVRLPNFATMHVNDGIDDQTFMIKPSGTGEGIDLLCDGSGACSGGILDVGQGTIRCKNDDNSSSGAACNAGFKAGCLQCLDNNSCGNQCAYGIDFSHPIFNDSCETQSPKYFGKQCVGTAPTASPTTPPAPTQSPTSSPSLSAAPTASSMPTTSSQPSLRPSSRPSPSPTTPTSDAASFVSSSTKTCMAIFGSIFVFFAMI